MSRAAATMQSTKGSTSTRPLLHGSGSPHISHLWRKHQSAPIIPLIEVHQDLGRLRWHILLNEMARFGEDLELIFPLHLADHQLLIQSICAGQQEEFTAARLQELPTEADEPVFPEGLRGGEVGSPDPWFCGV